MSVVAHLVGRAHDPGIIRIRSHRTKLQHSIRCEGQRSMSIGSSYAWPVSDWPAIRHIWFRLLTRLWLHTKAPEVRTVPRIAAVWRIWHATWRTH